jgi:hypothetical protein
MTAKCSCGSAISGFDRSQTLKWKREHMQDHKRPKWILVLGHGPFVVRMR